MRAKEFIKEARPGGKMHPHHAAAGLGGTQIFRDIGGYDRVYHLNRVMMAAAMADGKSTDPVEMDSSSFVEKFNVVFPYTDAEHAMMMQAFATVPTDSTELEKRSKSQEPDDTNIKSIIATPKKNQYGI